MITEKEFAKALKASGSSLEKFLELRKQICHNIAYSFKLTFSDVIRYNLDWSYIGLEDEVYWKDVMDRIDRFDRRLIAKKEECISRYAIRKNSSNWEVGYQTISRKQRKVLFEKLAADLGYTIKET